MKPFGIANWKTTFGGLAIISVQVAQIIGHPFNNEQVNSITAIAAALALLFAKDNNVTGGSTTNTFLK